MSERNTALELIKEENTATLQVSFADEDGGAVTPSSGTYQIDDESGQSVKAETGISPSAATHNITITGAENAIICDDKAYETRTVTVTWTNGTITGKDIYQYQVQNLKYVT